MRRSPLRPAALAAALLTVPLLAGPLASPAAATDPPPTPGLAAGATASDALLVVYRRTDGRVALRQLTDGLYPVEDAGGSVRTSPVAMYRAGPEINLWVYAVGANGAVYRRGAHRAPEGWVWKQWTSLGGYTTSAPAITCNAAGTVVVWIRGGDGALWRRTADTPWQRLGGAITSAPSAAGSNAGLCQSTEYVVALGADKAVWENRDGAWHKVGGASAYAPAFVRTITHSYVLVTGTDGALYLASRGADGAAWSPFRRLGGALTSAPAATWWGGGLTVLALGGNGQLYRTTQPPGTAGSWPFVPFG